MTFSMLYILMIENSLEIFRQRRDRVLLSFSSLQASAHDYHKARHKTGECLELVYSYMGRQDEQFYARLRNFYQSNHPATKIIDFLTQDIKMLKVQTFVFFEKYGPSNPLEQGKNFVRDLREYYQLLSERFRVEEDHLVPLLKGMIEEDSRWVVRK